MFWKITEVKDLKNNLKLTCNDDSTHQYIKQVCEKINESRNQHKAAIINGLMRGFLDVKLISLKIMEELNKMSSVFLNTNDMSFAFDMCKSEIVKKVIGLNGYYFKMTTEAQGSVFIWHSKVDSEQNFGGRDYIYVWGNKTSIIRSLNELQHRFYKVISSLWHKISSFNSLNMGYEMNEVVFENEYLKSSKFLNQLDEENHPFSDQNDFQLFKDESGVLYNNEIHDFIKIEKSTDTALFAERPRTIGGSSIFRDPNYDHDGNPIVSEEKKNCAYTHWIHASSENWGDLVTSDEESDEEDSDEEKEWLFQLYHTISEQDKRELSTNKWDKIEFHWQNWTTPREYYEVINGYPYLPEKEELKPKAKSKWYQYEELLKPPVGLKRHDALTYYSDDDEDDKNEDNLCKITRSGTYY